MTETRTVYTETYRGHAIAITERDGIGWDDRPHTTRTARIDDYGQGYRCPTGTDEQVAKKLRKTVDTMIADAEILPQLVQLVDRAHGLELVALPGAPKVGDVVYVYAMGHNRRGLVTKVAKTRAEVAYTTASSDGRVFRKSEPFTAISFRPNTEAHRPTTTQRHRQGVPYTYRIDLSCSCGASHSEHLDAVGGYQAASAAMQVWWTGHLAETR